MSANCTGFRTVTVTHTTAVSIGKPPDYTKGMLCSIEDDEIRWRADGTDPTATVGRPFNVGDTFVVWGARDLASVRFIRQGSVSATLSTDFARQVA